MDNSLLLNQTPVGKTSVKVMGNMPEANLLDGDVGYIDGYVVHPASAGVYAILIKKDGTLTMAPTEGLKAI